MVWQNGGRGSNIPDSTKRIVRARQNNCCAGHDASVCTGLIDEFDHVINVKSLGIDRSQANHPDLLQGLCKPCHKKKTQAEAQAGRTKHLRTPPQHPGLTGKKEPTNGND